MQTKNMLRRQYMPKKKIIKEPREPSKFDVLLTFQRQEIMHFIENCTFFKKEMWIWRFFQQLQSKNISKSLFFFLMRMRDLIDRKIKVCK